MSNAIIHPAALCSQLVRLRSEMLAEARQGFMVVRFKGVWFKV